MIGKIKEFLFGKPKAHNVPVKLNRKQKRVQAALSRKQAAKNRRKRKSR